MNEICNKSGCRRKATCFQEVYSPREKKPTMLYLCEKHCNESTDMIMEWVKE